MLVLQKSQHQEIIISNIQIIPGNEKLLFEFIEDSIHSCKVNSVEIENAKYHHNTNYEKAPLLIKNGILSLKERALLEQRTISQDELNKYNDDTHVNGSDQISLSSLDIDHSTISKKEWLYDPYMPSDVDINISSNIKARRNSTNYANEYLVDKKVLNEDFKAIDIRLLKLIKELENKKIDGNKLKKIISNYNDLKKIAFELQKNELDIPLREMSNENITLDLNKVINLPEIKTK